MYMSSMHCVYVWRLYMDHTYSYAICAVLMGLFHGLYIGHIYIGHI